MSKALNSIIGLDLGRASLKSVVMQRRGGGRTALTHYATRPLTSPIESAEQLSTEVRALFKELGGGSKACAVAISHPDAIVRIIDQPETPCDLLREALRLNGVSLLNQDCREFVLDCDQIEVTSPGTLETGRRRYLVGGAPRSYVTTVNSAFGSVGADLHGLQIGPVSLLNAFEFAQAELFANHAFFLVDIGHANTTMLLGAKRELVLVRTVDIGGKAIIETLMALSGESASSVMIALDQEDEFMIENAGVALMNLAREVGSSIGFFEARREETIAQVFVSGGVAKSKTLLRVLGEELHMPCTSWNPLESCEIAVSGSQRDNLDADVLDLHVACGAAAEALNS